MISAYEKFEGSLRELESTHRAMVSLESLVQHYNVESMEGPGLDMAIHYINSVLEANDIQVDELSLEEDGGTGTLTNPTGQSKGEKVKKYTQETIKKLMDRVKKLPAEIKEYAKLVMDTLANSSKALSNTANGILSRLDSVETTQRKITGPFSIFESTRPQMSIEFLIKGLGSMNTQTRSALDVVSKTSPNANSTLTLYNYKGMEFKFDGTARFFDSKLDLKKVEINGLSKADVKLVCEKTLVLADAIEKVRSSLPDMEDLINKVVRRVETTSTKEGAKVALEIGSFYRKVVGGYIKYTIKVSKMAMKAADASIKTSKKSEESKDE